jgi:hypothetical protein
MSRFSQLFLGAVCCVGAAVLPARADVHQLGDVNISAGHYTHVSWSRFDGPVLRLRFVADNDTVDCEHVLVTYRDGTVHDVFSGIMPRHTVETITFPEGDSHLRNVEFACKAANRDGARITLSAVSEGEGLTQKDNDWRRGADLHTSTGGP